MATKYQGLVKKIAPAVAGLGMLAGANSADATLITDIKNHYNPSESTGKIVFNIYDTDPNKKIDGIVMSNFFGGDLPISDVISYNGPDYILNKYFNLGNNLGLSDLDMDGILNASLVYNNPRSLNINGFQNVTYTDNSYLLHQPYSVKNVLETNNNNTVPAPDTVLLLGAGFAGLGYANKRSRKKIAASKG